MLGVGVISTPRIPRVYSVHQLKLSVVYKFPRIYFNTSLIECLRPRIRVCLDSVSGDWPMKNASVCIGIRILLVPRPINSRAGNTPANIRSGHKQFPRKFVSTRTRPAQLRSKREESQPSGATKNIWKPRGTPESRRRRPEASGNI